MSEAMEKRLQHLGRLICHLMIVEQAIDKINECIDSIRVTDKVVHITEPVLRMWQEQCLQRSAQCMTEMTLFRGVLQARRFCLVQQIDAECNRILKIDDNEPSFSEYASDDESEGEGPAASWWGEGDG